MTTKADGEQTLSTTESDSVSEMTTDVDSWNETESEGYHTEYQMRIQKQTPVYRPLDDQVVKAAETLSTDSKGFASSAPTARRPQAPPARRPAHFQTRTGQTRRS